MMMPSPQPGPSLRNVATLLAFQLALGLLVILIYFAALGNAAGLFHLLGIVMTGRFYASYHEKRFPGQVAGRFAWMLAFWVAFIYMVAVGLFIFPIIVFSMLFTARVGPLITLREIPLLALVLSVPFFTIHLLLTRLGLQWGHRKGVKV